VSKQNVEVLRRLYDRFAQGDFWAARDVLDPEIEWEWSASMMDVVGGQRTTYRGPDGVERALRDWLEAWDWFWVEADELFPAGDKVLASIRRRGRAKGSELELETRAFDVWTMKNGKAIHYKTYDDREEAFEAVGSKDASKLESAG
jgi:ketosteroid isomerase-like protein